MPKELTDRKSIARRISAHFSTRFDQEWVKWKLIADSLCESLAPWLMASPLPVLDVGCGRGLLGFYLRESGHRAGYMGIDFDATKITPAREVAAHYDPVPRYHLLDALQEWPESTGHVCVLDVLHYLPAEAQAGLLKKAAAHVAPGGLFIIRSGIRDAGWRYKVTAATDRVMAACKLMKTPPLCYPEQGFIANVLSGAGLTLQQCHPPGPAALFNNHLLVFQKETARA